MADPLEVLREPVFPIAPDPSFAAQLHARVERALNLPKGAPMATTTVTRLEADAATAPTEDGVVPYLAVHDAAGALDWYVAAFGARRLGEPIVMPDGRIGHAELEIAGGRVMLSDAYPEIGVVAPEPGAGVTFSLHANVADVDVATDRAVRAGAVLERAPADYPYGRNAVVRDPFGHRWMLASPAPVPAPAPEGGRPRQGDIGYVSLWVPDVERAAAFFSSVLGWRYGPASGPQGRQVEGLTLHHGLWGGEARSSLFLCLSVDDVAVAAERVRAGGGTASVPSAEPYGLLSECTDDQGMRFALFEPPAGSDGGRGPANGDRHGDISYITVEVADSAKFRAFFGAVAGWRFSRGRVEDGWGVDDVVPMTGVQGGHAHATGVPMYRVDDIAAAVERVRAAGGAATEPEAQPYGLTSECTDDQGTRFSLGQH
jgi:uncharacterized glyoxalase superfamily protein PhnB